MADFQTLWDAHPGRGFVCDATVFGNQCAMRVGNALRAIGANVAGLKTCVNYDRATYRAHGPGHIRAAQDIANHFYRVSAGKGLGAKGSRYCPARCPRTWTPSRLATLWCSS